MNLGKKDIQFKVVITTLQNVIFQKEKNHFKKL